MQLRPWLFYPLRTSNLVLTESKLPSNTVSHLFNRWSICSLFLTGGTLQLICRLGACYGLTVDIKTGTVSDQYYALRPSPKMHWSSYPSTLKRMTEPIWLPREKKIILIGRASNLNDECHVFWALSQIKRSSMKYTFPSNKWTFMCGHSHSGHHTNTHIVQVRSQRLNCSRFENRIMVLSPSTHCRNLQEHRNKSSILSDVHNFKSFITFHVFSLTYSCR